MVFALLTAAIVWNLGTWYFGLPSSSSHTLIGSIIGVGVANQMMATNTATSGVDWAQAAKVGQQLLLSPLVGFGLAFTLLTIAKAVIPDKRLYQAPDGTTPPPFWIRCLLVLTCTGVSFAHGSNDGQKGMGLIMLILVGIVPTAYALEPRDPRVAHGGVRRSLESGRRGAEALFSARRDGRRSPRGRAGVHSHPNAQAVHRARA